jgi:hypothetical protein
MNALIHAYDPDDKGTIRFTIFQQGSDTHLQARNRLTREVDSLSAYLESVAIRPTSRRIKHAFGYHLVIVR